MADVLKQHGGTALQTRKIPPDVPNDENDEFPIGDDAGGGTDGGGQTGSPTDAAPGTNGAGKCADKPAGGGGKAPGGSGGGGKPGGGGGGKPGGKTAGGGGGGKPAGDPSGGGKPAGDSGGAAKPADAPVPPALAGKSAKECAEFATSALSKLEGLEAQAKTIASASEKFVTDAQAGKKAAEDAQTKADETEKALPPVPTVAAPTGADDKQKYESALKISGDVDKVAADAAIQCVALKATPGSAKEGQEDVNRIQEAASQNAETLKTYASQATGHASGAAGAASEAQKAASDARQKADKAAKDKSPDKDDLKKKADEEAKDAKAASDAATKAQTIAQAIGEMSKKMEADSATINTLKTETTAIVDAVTAKGDSADSKLTPYEEASQKAEEQEAECKAKLSEDDAKAILEKRYEELGGDAALKRLLDEADKYFNNETEMMRAAVKDWKEDQFRELEKMSAANTQDLEQFKKTQKGLQEFSDRETPLSKKISERIDKLGDKKDTQRGKEIAFEYSMREGELGEADHLLSQYKGIIEKTEAVKEQIDGRYGPIKEAHDANERYLKARETEFDNQIELETMSLEKKVETLESTPEAQIKKFVELMRAEKERIVAESVDDIKLQAQSFDAPRETKELKPIDWSGLEKALAYVESKTVEELKGDDAGLAKVQEAYDKAGGDAALFKKLHDEWQQLKLQHDERVQSANKRSESNTEKLRVRLNEASASEAKTKEEVESLKSHHDEAKAELEEILKVPESDRTTEQRAREKFLKREVPRLEKEFEAEQSRLSTITTNKESIEKLMTSQKEQIEAVQDDDHDLLIEPAMGQLAAVPLRSKYVKLTGKEPPA
jgi:hypothetical protein